MKTINTIKYIVLITIFSSLLIFNACKKDNSTSTTAVTYGTVLFHLHTNVDTNEVDNYGDMYTMTGGRMISVSNAQLYLSSIQLQKADGSYITVPTSSILKVQETEPYTLGNVPTGNYKSVMFNVGLTSAQNLVVPSAADTNYQYRPEMWFTIPFSASTGYKFINFEGAIDTTASGMGGMAAMAPFRIHIGTNANLKMIMMPDQNFTITKGAASEVHMIIDYNKLFHNIDLTVQANRNIITTSDNSSSNAAAVANNIQSMFSYE